MGELRTRRGTIETPYLFPVIDMARQEVSLAELMAVGFQAVTINAYLLLKRGHRGSIHELLGTHELVVMTDSGAYQLLEYGSIDVDNETIVEFQKEIDSDIAVILDVPTGDSYDRDWALYTVEETLRRAQSVANKLDRDKRLWVLPVQGGLHLDLVEKSAAESAKLDFDLYALGSPTRMLEKYRYDLVIDMVAASRKHIPPAKPLHLFGAGHPMMIPFAVAMGVDLFDSSSYILFARDGRYVTSSGTRRLEQLSCLPCCCPVCSKLDVTELLELEPSERTRLLATHNLYAIQLVLRETKQAIKEGRLWELLEEYSRKHPSLRRALGLIARKHANYLEKLDPRYNSGARAPLIYSTLSLTNPRISRALKYVRKQYTPPRTVKRLIMLPRFRRDEESITEEDHVVYYDELLGIIPSELSRTYPLGHAVTPGLNEKGPSPRLIKAILSYLRRHGESYPDSKTVVLCAEWRASSSRLAEFVSKSGVKVEWASCFAPISEKALEYSERLPDNFSALNSLDNRDLSRLA